MALFRRSAKPADGRMTIWSHLAELRHRLFVSVIAVAVGAVVGYIVAPTILEWFLHYYRDAADQPNGKFIFLSALDPFLIRLKIATYVGLLLASPVWLWQFWRFVTPALNPREKRYAVPFIVTSIFLFCLGAVFALITVPAALDFLLQAGGSALEPALTADKFLGLVTLMILAFGVSFEFPVILVFLLLVRVLSVARLQSWRKAMYVGIFFFAAVITPSQDPYSLFFMAVPMILFYEISIVVGKVLKR